MTSSDVDVEQRLAEQKSREKLLRDQHASDIRAVLDLPAGRRVLERIVFEFGGLLELSHSHTEHQSKFNEGQRAVGKAFDRELFLAARDGWARMHNERIERLRAEPEAKAETDQ